MKFDLKPASESRGGVGTVRRVRGVRGKPGMRSRSDSGGTRSATCQ